MFKIFRTVKALAVAALFSVTVNSVNADSHLTVNHVDMGAGANSAHVLFNTGSGAAYLYEVHFAGSVTGLDLLNAIQADTTAANEEMTFGSTYAPAGQFPADEFIDWITIEGENGVNDTVNWTAYWSYYVRDEASVPWGWATSGALGRTVVDGDWDAWSFTGSAPTGVEVPEPASMILMAVGVAMLATRRQK